MKLHYGKNPGAAVGLFAAAALATGATGAAEPLRLTLLDAAGQPAGDTVVYLQGATPERLAPGAAHAAVDQRNKAFVPNVLVVQTGTAVDFPNHDTVSHHVYSFSPDNAFELPLYKGAPSRAVVMQHAGVVTLGCNIHDRMLGYIVVVDTPFFGITARDGTLTVPGVKAGHYQVMAWSPRLDATRSVPVAALDVPPGPAMKPAALRLDRRMKNLPPSGGNGLSWGDY